MKPTNSHIFSCHFLDPDECIDPTLNDCDENAICKNVQLSFTCACREGFTDAGHPGGPGRKCVKDDNRTVVIQQEITKLQQNDERQAAEFNQLWSDSRSEIEDWAYTTIAFVVIASLLVFMFFGLAVYVYKARPKPSKYFRTGISGEA